MPFVVTDESPILFIEPDEQTTHRLSCPPTLPHQSVSINETESEHLAYAQAFNQTLQALRSGQLQKMVLARQLHCKGLPVHQAEALFQAACHSRPHNFVALWSNDQFGSWLIATPEPLFCMRDDLCHTVALAGTMPYNNETAPPHWNKKNKEEQAIVAHFIRKELQPFANELIVSATHTLQSGNIQHLCTNFTFRLRPEADQRTLIAQLHPTPAVCGMPRNEALQRILTIETEPRTYYAGFSGPFNLRGETSLYVTLRCMHFTEEQSTLYAGGGIMPNSNEQEEWEETIRKMQTMLQLL